MISSKTVAEAVMRQHTAAVEKVIRDVSHALEKAGLWAPETGKLLHDFVKTTTQPGKYPTTTISIKRSSRWEAVGEVKTVLDGNTWRTETAWWGTKLSTPLPPEPSSGGSALYGSPQDAMGSEFCQLPLPSPEGHKLGWPSLSVDSADVVAPGVGKVPYGEQWGNFCKVDAAGRVTLCCADCARPYDSWMVMDAECPCHTDRRVTR